MPEVTLLPVPHVSQIGPGADRFRNDCGAASAALLIRAYTGQIVTPDDVFSQITQEDRYLCAGELIIVLKQHGIPTVWRGLDAGSLYRALADRQPPIALIKAIGYTIVWFTLRFSGADKTKADAEKTEAEADLLKQKGYQTAIADLQQQITTLRAELEATRRQVREQDTLIRNLQMQLARVEAERNLWRDIALNRGGGAPPAEQPTGGLRLVQPAQVVPVTDAPEA